MSETTVVIDGHTYERDRGVWWIVLAKGRVPVMPMALDEVVRLRAAIEKAATNLGAAHDRRDIEDALRAALGGES